MKIGHKTPVIIPSVYFQLVPFTIVDLRGKRSSSCMLPLKVRNTILIEISNMI